MELRIWIPILHFTSRRYYTQKQKTMNSMNINYNITIGTIEEFRESFDCLIVDVSDLLWVVCFNKLNIWKELVSFLSKLFNELKQLFEIEYPLGLLVMKSISKTLMECVCLLPRRAIIGTITNFPSIHKIYTEFIKKILSPWKNSCKAFC